MSSPTEGYVYHSYGPERYVHHVVASVETLRRYDTTRPVALYCPPHHQAALAARGLSDAFAVLEDLPEPHHSIVGFKHSLDRFKPFDRSLFLDADMVFCRNPDPLWAQLSSYPFTATGLQRADFFFGGPKGAGVLLDMLLMRRQRTLRRFGLTHLPRVQAGMIYAQDDALTEEVCALASSFLDQVDAMHFRSRLDEGRSEETCEWSLAMAMSKRNVPVFPWWQGINSPQLDFIEGLTTYDPDFCTVRCRYYSSRFTYSLRGIPLEGLRDTLISLVTKLPGFGDYMYVTPFILHFGWIHQKQPFYEFAERVWAQHA
ncbi:glycosyltransferase family protein [Salisaeta longa]|uniref:hypothetical protein n=1 Tax=Salisaeta longa TaxID=503170 RepID=UPI0003B4CD6B|nr:hypothetical protein [Salisaeta longa]